MTNLKRRVEQIERERAEAVAAGNAGGPAYLVFKTSAEAEAHDGPPVKAYIGFAGPDAWQGRVKSDERENAS